MNNYLVAESLIATRLRETIPDIKLIIAHGKPPIQESPSLPPAILLMLEEDRPGDATEGGISQKIEQIWCCMVVTRGGENVNGEPTAGEVIARILRALSGWRPPGLVFSRLSRVRSSSSPETSPSGMNYYPVSFQTEFVFNV